MISGRWLWPVVVIGLLLMVTMAFAGGFYKTRGYQSAMALWHQAKKSVRTGAECKEKKYQDYNVSKTHFDMAKQHISCARMYERAAAKMDLVQTRFTRLLASDPGNRLHYLMMASQAKSAARQYRYMAYKQKQIASERKRYAKRLRQVGL